MKYIRFKASYLQNFNIFSTIRSVFSKALLWKSSLFISVLCGVILSHLGIFHLPVNAALNSDIAILNAFVPNSAPPGVAVTYRLTFRNITGSPVNITSLSHTFPGAPGSLVFDDAAPTLN